MDQAPCTSTLSDKRMDLFPFSYIRRTLGNVAGFDVATQAAIDLVGVDASTRTCGAYRDAQAMQYVFTTNFRPIYEFLRKNHLHNAEYPKVDDQLAADEASAMLNPNESYPWMVSIPQARISGEPMRICAYRAGLVTAFPNTGGAPPPSGAGGSGGGNANGSGNDNDSDGDSEDVVTPQPSEDVAPSLTPVPEEDDSSGDGSGIGDSDAGTGTGTDDTATASNSQTPTPNTFDQGNTFGNANDDGSDSQAESPDSSSSSSCFPGSAVVTTLSNGNSATPNSVEPLEHQQRRMSQLRIGDRVCVGSDNMTSTVFAFTHYEPERWATFVQLSTASGGALQATHGHYIYTLPSGSLKTARQVRVGDYLQRADDGSQDEVVEVREVRMKGVYNAQTMHGDIAVNGFRVSTYTEAIEASRAHAMLAPVRAVYRWCGVAVTLRRVSGGLLRFA